METIEAIYENGILHFDKEPPKKKSKVILTFVDNKETRNKMKLPEFNLGNIYDVNREELYEERISYWY